MKLTKTKLKGIIKGELHQLDEGWLPTEFRKELPKGLVSQVSKKIGWNIATAFAFCVDLLEDVNAHDVAKKVNGILDKELDKFNKDLEDVKGKFKK